MASSNSPSSTLEKSSSSSTTSSASLTRQDPLYLHPSDSPGLQLVSNHLTLVNYMIWSRSMRIALKAKNKLGFIDGSCAPPSDSDSEAFSHWSFVDSMVISWILNSMTKDISEAYVYASSAHSLWRELEEKFGETDRPRVFHLRKELSSIEQGSDSIAAYSNRLKKVWDELHCLEPLPKCVCNGCTCGAFKRLADMSSSCLVMQFLFGLSAAYDTVVNNILLLDPLPPFNKVYSMISRIEKQLSVNAISAKSVESSVLMAKAVDSSKSGGSKSSQKKKDSIKKEDRFCDFCSRAGHLEESCFKKHGYPDWYKEKYPKDKKNVAVANAAVLDSDDSASISDLVQQEVKRYMKQKSPIIDDTPSSAAYFADFAGTLSSFTISNARTRWILDSGASSHVCGTLSLLSHIRSPSYRHTVQLPDGTVKLVQFIGTVSVTPDVVLTNVLYIPAFKYNL